MRVDVASPLRFQTLGPLQVMRGDEILPLGPPLQRVVLAALLVEGSHPVPVPVLLDRLWDDDPPDTAVKSIQKYVSNLRRLLGPERIVSNGGYGLVVGPDEVDSLEFERALTASAQGDDLERRLFVAEGALRMWRGEPYADLPQPLFLEPVRARLVEIRQVLTEARLGILLELGHLAEVATETRELVELHPLRERLWQLRMSALARAGRQAEALSEFKRLRRLLGEELGLDPSPETMELEEKILLQDPALTPAPREQGNLPSSTASVIARSAEIEAMASLLGSTRLLTVVGTAGVGKTTLALELARRVASQFGHGAWFVGLGPITEPDRVAGRTAETLGVVDTSGGPADEALIEYLAKRRALIVLDNCEHVIEGVARLTSRLLGRAPGVTIVATSRQPVGVAGETIFDLEGLETPPPGAPPDASLRYPAVQLLATRADEAGAHLEPLEEVAGPLGEISRRLDGVPLAIELAAARLRYMSASDLAERLTTHLRPLVSTRRDLPERQRSLDAAVDWSFQLLEEHDKRLLARLSVFRGGFTFEAAQQVCGWDIPDVMAALSGLVDHSMVTVLPRAGGSHRYHLLWVIRLFAESKLENDTAETRQRHADYYLRFVEPQDPRPLHPPARGLDELGIEYENLRAAMTFSLQSGEAETGLRLAAALGTFWIHSGFLGEAQRWLERYLSVTPDAPAELRIRALMALADAYDPSSSDMAVRTAEISFSEAKATADPLLIAAASSQLGRMHALRFEREAALPLIQEALATFEKAGDMWWMAQCHEALGVASRGSTEDVGHYRQAISLYRAVGADHEMAQALFSMAFRSLIPNGRFEEARVAVEESAALAKRIGSAQQYVHAHTALGQVARLEGELDEASDLLEEALVGVREFGDRRCTVRMLTALSRIDLLNGDMERAWARLTEATRVGVELDQGISSDTHELVDALGLFAVARGEGQTAARWLGASESIRASQGLLRPPPDQLVVDEAIGHLEHALGPDRTRVLLEEGSALSLEDLGVELMGLDLSDA